jgi:hypothetical protein
MSAFVAVLAAFFVFGPVSSALRGWVLVCLWVWFVEPVFGLAAPSVVNAIGLSLLVSLLTHQVADKKQEDRGPWMSISISFGTSTVVSLVSLLAGWIVHQFA